MISQPAFAVLDVVRTTEGSGVVLAVRRYPDGAHRYEVGTHVDAPDDDVPGIYDESQLRPTGRRAAPEPYGPVAPFRLRDVVEIDVDHPDVDVRGRRGVVRGADGDGNPEVWVDDLAEMVGIDARRLVRTGNRVPLLPVPRDVVHWRKGTAGELVAEQGFVLLDEIDQYL